MKKALLIIGDAWHAPSIINRAIGNRLEERGYLLWKAPGYEVPFENLEEFDMVVLSRYAFHDGLNTPEIDAKDRIPWISSRQEALIEQYVSEGGRLLLHHDGIGHYKRGNGICRLSKAFCDGHPPIGPITVSPVPGHDFLNRGIEPYIIYDEEFNLELKEEETNVFLESFSERNGRRPQGWYHSYGKGKVIVFVPGHDDTVLRHPMVKQGILNILDWLEEGQEAGN